MTRATGVLVLVLLLAPGVLRAEPGNPVTPRPIVDLAWNRFYDTDEMLVAMRRLEKAHPGWLRLESLGKSHQGRDLWLVTLSDPASPGVAGKPAIYIDANVHGNEIQGTEVCLYTMWWLLENRERNERVRDLLRRVTFHLVPSVNPDGRQSRFDDPNSANSPRTGMKPVDDDRDGEADEDGPDDLDGDGSITRMRKRVARGGTHRIDPDDPRLMVPVPSSEEGTHVLLGHEGIDDDGDGEVNEDGPGSYDMNRNWPGDWQPAWIQWGAGPYPLCYPETRAVADFLLKHPEIAAVQSYHNTGGMILRGPGQRGIADYPHEDVRVYDALGHAGEEMLPHYRYMKIGDDLYPVRGGFVTWAFEGLGAFAFTNELWSWRQQSNEPREKRSHDDWSPERRAERDRKRLRWTDRMDLGAKFVPWKPFDHPTLGKIEIGGWVKTASRVPPTFMLEEMCHRNAMFTIHHADQMPLLAFDPVETTSLGGGLWRVRATVRNERLIPTIAAYARKHGIGLPDFFAIAGEGVEVVAGGRLEGERFRERVVPQEHRPRRLRIDAGVPSHGRVRVEWIVKWAGEGPPAVTITCRSQKGGTVTATSR